MGIKTKPFGKGITGNLMHSLGNRQSESRYVGQKFLYTIPGRRVFLQLNDSLPMQFPGGQQNAFLAVVQKTQKLVRKLKDQVSLTFVVSNGMYGQRRMEDQGTGHGIYQPAVELELTGACQGIIYLIE